MSSRVPHETPLPMIVLSCLHFAGPLCAHTWLCRADLLRNSLRGWRIRQQTADWALFFNELGGQQSERTLIRMYASSADPYQLIGHDQSCLRRGKCARRSQ